jgi:hypothetical protein
MLRSLFMMTAISSLASATTTTYVFCSAGATTQTGSTACTLQSSHYFVSATAQVPASQDPSAVVSASAGYQAGLNPPPPFGKLQIAVKAYASETETFATTGPPRSGVIQFDISMSSRFGGTADAIITDGMHMYSFSCGPGSLYGCSFNEQVTFDLGAVFEATASGSAEASGLFTPGETVLAGPLAAVESISLFESDGTTPVAFSLVPEPSTRDLALFGFAAAALLFGGTSVSLKRATRFGCETGTQL